MNYLQNLVDGMSAEWQRDRSRSQLTLGALIETLSELPADTMIDGICEPHSYRGYYCDLAFELCEKKRADEVLEECISCMGKVFDGYKGGDYVMGALTPLWIAEYGCCGVKIIALTPNGIFSTAEEDE